MFFSQELINYSGLSQVFFFTSTLPTSDVLFRSTVPRKFANIDKQVIALLDPHDKGALRKVVATATVFAVFQMHDGKVTQPVNTLKSHHLDLLSLTEIRTKYGLKGAVSALVLVCVKRLMPPTKVSCNIRSGWGTATFETKCQDLSRWVAMKPMGSQSAQSCSEQEQEHAMGKGQDDVGHGDSGSRATCESSSPSSSKPSDPSTCEERPATEVQDMSNHAVCETVEVQHTVSQPPANSKNEVGVGSMSGVETAKTSTPVNDDQKTRAEQSAEVVTGVHGSGDGFGITNMTPTPNPEHLEASPTAAGNLLVEHVERLDPNRSVRIDSQLTVVSQQFVHLDSHLIFIFSLALYLFIVPLA